MGKRVLIVDLNNFALYPSIAIGYLTAVLKAGGFHVDLMAPLSVGVTGVLREPRPPWWGRLDLEFRYRTGVSRNRLVRHVRARYAAYHSSKLARSRHQIAADFSHCLDRGYDAVLVSTYLMYFPHCEAIGKICRDRGVPMLLGGPYFADKDVARQWIDMPGLSALVGGEVEPHLCDLVERVIARQPTERISGVWSREGAEITLSAPPLADLDRLPFPDYSQFPWARYPKAIVPIITGRGCGWGVCTFCSDVTSTAGRTFRSRSATNVLDEIGHQARQHDARLFVFTDLKLNSDLQVWRSLARDFPRVVPGARWIGAVHVGIQGENGLTAGELEAAAAAGMVRLTTGFETGSQQLLDRMAKGVDLKVTSRFLADAHRAGISVRMTMFTGYPYERAEDVEGSAAYLEDHQAYIERIFLGRFQIRSGTTFERRLERKPGRFPGLSGLKPNLRLGQIGHHYVETERPEYRRAISRLIRVVHAINRKPLSPSARDFEGVM